jgi:exopolysaccharide production protein ExoQ
MPPILASFLTIGFMAWLFWRDFREKPNVTSALWIPILWMFLISTRPVSKWLGIFGLPTLGGDTPDEGSPLDVLVFLGLIAVGATILAKRQVNFGKVIRDNAWLLALVLYFFISILWSDFALTSFKRWIKIIGHPIMVLIVFTEPDPKEALLRLMKRCAYVLLPVSILWIKYYSRLGRKHDEYGGMTNCGITAGKNVLGIMACLLALFFVWHLFQVWRAEKGRTRWRELQLTGGLLLLCAYCLAKAHSATSDICFILGTMVMVFLGLRFVNKRLIGAYAAGVVLLLVIAQLTFDIYAKIVDMSGHESTLEGRGVLWEQLLHFGTNPIFGVGFETFWMGDNLVKLHEGRPWQPNEAHNGYIELYLEGGIIALLLLAGVVLSAYQKIRRDLVRNFEWGRVQMALLIVLLAHSWTEAGFRGLSLPFFVFFIIATDYPWIDVSISPPASGIMDSEVHEELVYSDAKVEAAG